VVNGLLVLAVGYLLYNHIKSSGPGGLTALASGPDSSNPANQFRIAYFEMDSIEANYKMVKDVKAELNKREETINNELNGMDKTYRDKVNSYQQKARDQSMSQVQSEMATQDLMSLQDQMKNRKQTLDQEYNDLMIRKMKDVKSRIEDFLKVYNQNRHYSYIVSYEQGLFYYKDTIYNITKDVIQGLNDQYKPSKN